MLIDGYVAEQMNKSMLNSEQEQVKIYDAYYNRGYTDGYNKALEKQIPKEQFFEDGSCNTELVYDTWICPNCNSKYKVGIDYDYCPNCGQRIDWE